MILKIKSLLFNTAGLLKAEGSGNREWAFRKGTISTQGKELQTYGSPSLTLRLVKPCLKECEV